jgi:HK97 family phage major capsid protein
MKVKDYVGQVVDEAVSKQLEDIRKKESKDLIIDGGRSNTVDADEKALTSQFYKALSTGKQAHLEEVSSAIYKSYKEKAQAVSTVGTGTSGGILVPTSVANSIVSKMQYVSPIRQIATVIDNMPAQLQLPSENSIATGYWIAEGAPATDSGEVFDPNLLTPYKAAGLDSFTSEVIADAATNPSIQNYVESRFAIALALLENAGFTNGDGNGKPYGFRSSAITPNSVAQVGDTLAYNDVTALKYSLKTAYRQMAVFVVSSTAAQALENVKDNYGRPIWREGLAEDTPARLLGRPVYIVDEIPSTLGASSNQTEIWYGVFQNYFIGDRGALRVDYGTNGTDFANDKISLRMLKRVAGRPVIGESFSKLTAVM